MGTVLYQLFILFEGKQSRYDDGIGFVIVAVAVACKQNLKYGLKLVAYEMFLI